MIIRFPTKTNPLGLNIGERVRVNRACTVDYDKYDNRMVMYLPGPSHGIITGVVKKAIGKYVKGGGSLGYMDASEYDPPCLVVSKYVRLYECRTATDKKPFLVHPEDIHVP